MAFIYDLTDTWNAGATTFSAIKMNVTDTASASASKLVQCQISGTDKFTVGKDGGGYFAGKVGIGTSSPSQKLEVVGSQINTVADDVYATAFNATSGNVRVLPYFSPYGGSAIIAYGAGYAGLGTLALDNSLTRFLTNGSERMRIDSSGNLGLGTSSPQYILHAESSNPRIVSKGTSATSYASLEARNNLNSSLVTIGRGSTETGTILGQANANGAQIYTVNYDYLAVGTYTSDPLIFGTNNAERMRIDSSGNVGIGTTAPSTNLGSYKGLSIDGGVNGAVQISGTSFSAVLFGDAADPDVGQIAYGHSSNYMVFHTNATERMRIDSAGKVGIGTSAPSAPLHVNVSGTSDALVLTRDTGTNGQLQVDFTSALTNFNSVTGGFTFAQAGNERMRIDSAGNVGIGTSSPTELLDVNSDAIRIRTAQTPASATAAGNAGDICWDANYVYVCVATNTWKRSALSTW